MIIDKLGVPRLARPPHEANPPSIIDANAVLSNSIAFEGLKTIARRHTQILQPNCRVKHLKFGQRTALNLRCDAFHCITRE